MKVGRLISLIIVAFNIKFSSSVLDTKMVLGREIKYKRIVREFNGNNLDYEFYAYGGYPK